MSADCSSYYNADNELMAAFSCPKPDSDAGAVFCCGFNDIKYCCDDPNSFFPYEYGYMWWLRNPPFPPPVNLCLLRPNSHSLAFMSDPQVFPVLGYSPLEPLPDQMEAT
ncbi:SHL2A protein, partial [Polypterus senegalus]